MKYLMIDEYRAIEHGLESRIETYPIHTEYHYNSQMAGPIGLAANRWVRAIPETDPLYTYLVLKGVGWTQSNP